ncbi:MAG: hypothetical protein ABI807_00430, partial [Sporichthyaceae bacterium]
DPDLFWHRILGGYWLEHRTVRLSDAADPIAFSDGRPWRPTAWAMEVLYDVLVRLGGYEAVGLLRLAVAAVLFALLARYLHRQLPAPLAAGVLAVLCVPIFIDIQDRPQTVSFVFAALLLPSISAWVARGDLPSLLSTSLFTWAWANVHGLWIVVPGLLLVALISSPRDVVMVRATSLRLVVALVSACLTPVGPRLLLIPFALRDSTAVIVEWRPTALFMPFSIGFAACLVVVVVSWAKRASRIPNRLLLLTLCISVFGLMAYRNVTVSTILLLPSVVEATRTLFPGDVSRLQMPRAAVAIVGTLLLLVGASAYLREDVVKERYPTRIAQDLAGMDGRVRVLNDYNISGYLREFGGDHVRLAIDGRADRYGDSVIDRYSVMTDGALGWFRTFSSYHADVVVIDRRAALRELLLRDGWRTARVDHGFVLLTKRHP